LVLTSADHLQQVLLFPTNNLLQKRRDFLDELEIPFGL
jgi:hypothetical protein